MKKFSVRYGTLWPEGQYVQVLEDQLQVELGRHGIEFVITRFRKSEQILPYLLAGRLDIASTSSVMGKVPITSLLYMPFLYRDFNHFRSIWSLHGNAITLKAEREIENAFQLQVLGYSPVGARDCISVDRPIEDMKDFSGLNMRVDGTQISQEIFQNFGATTTEVSYYDVADALAAKRVEGAENAPFNMQTLGWVKHCKHLCLSEHRYFLNFELARKEFLSDLTSDARGLIESYISSHSGRVADGALIERKRSIGELKKQTGLSVNTLSKKGKKQLKDNAKQFVNDFAQEKGLLTELEIIWRA